MVDFKWTGIILILIIGIAGVALANDSRPALIFEIPAGITVAGPGLTFGDLGTFQGGATAGLEDLQKVNLGSAPLPGQVRRFTRSYLILIMQQHMLDKKFTLKMEEQVEVRVAATSITAGDFETMIANLLPSKKKGIVKKWVEIHNLPGEIRVGKSDGWRLDASVIGNMPEIGTVLFKVILSGGGTGNRIFNISGKVRETGLLYRAIRDIPRHAELRNSDFEIVENELCNGKELVGDIPVKIRSTKLIKRDEILKTDFFQPVPAVHKDHEVQVIVKGKSIEVRITGIAKNDGWLGNEIQIANQTSKKIFYAKVIGEEMVEVIFR
jgi:flagella basal body P-ring formation protein FlgA